MSKLSKDLAVGTLHPRESLFMLGTFGAINAEIIVPADGASSLALDLRGTFNMIIELSGTVDGVNWTPIPVRQLNAASVSYVASISGSGTGVWVGKCAQYKSVRARVTAYTSGSATAVLLTDTGRAGRYPARRGDAPCRDLDWRGGCCGHVDPAKPRRWPQTLHHWRIYQPLRDGFVDCCRCPRGDHDHQPPRCSGFLVRGRSGGARHNLPLARGLCLSHRGVGTEHGHHHCCPGNDRCHLAHHGWLLRRAIAVR